MVEMTNKDHEVIVIGGGLAGTEATWQIARSGVRVTLYEMRPEQKSPAHIHDLAGGVLPIIQNTWQN